MTIEYVIPIEANPVNVPASLTDDIIVDDISDNINFRKSLFDLINLTSLKKYSILIADLIKPQRAADYSVRNTTITLIEVPNLGIFNPKEVRYNRIHTSRLGVVSIFKGNFFKVTDAVDQINAILNTTISRNELVDFMLPVADSNGNVSIVLLFNDTSARYYSGPEVILKPTGGADATKQSIGLSNVDDTSDINKPMSVPQLAAAATAKAFMQAYVTQQIQIGIDNLQTNSASYPIWTKLEW